MEHPELVDRFIPFPHGFSHGFLPKDCVVVTKTLADYECTEALN
jgi:hypothetical protein